MTWEHHQQDGTIKTAGDGVPPMGVVASAYRAAAITPGAGIYTKVAVDTKIYDPYAYMDLTNGRFTPKVAGYYHITGAVSIQFTAAAGTQAIVGIFKNSVEYIRGSRDTTAAAAEIYDATVSCDVYLNGTTDYVELFFYSQAAGSGLELNVVMNHLDAHLIGASVGVVPEPWHIVGASGEPAFQNSWVNFGGVFPVAAFFKDPVGMVHTKGLVKSGTSASAVIFTLPAGYRPLETQNNVVGGNGAYSELQVQSNGNVNIQVAGSTANQWIPIHFRAEQ